MWLLLLFFSALLQADDEFSSERYCFSTTNVQLARQKLGLIEVRSDVIKLDGNCLMVNMRPHRRELIQKFVMTSFEDANVTFSSESLRKDPCKLKVEKEKIKKAEELNIEVNKDKVKLVSSGDEGSVSEVMQIQTLKEFLIRVDQEEISGKCNPVTPDKYIVTLEIKIIPPPVLQNLPPGSVVIMNQPPANQEALTLKTEVHLARSERIEIGEIVKKLKDKNGSAGLTTGLSTETKNQNLTEKVFLSLQ